jgi:hypothetical protein
MGARQQRQWRQTAMLIKRAQRVMHESRKLLEQREMQLKQLEHFNLSAVHRGIRGRESAVAEIE